MRQEMKTFDITINSLLLRQEMKSVSEAYSRSNIRIIVLSRERNRSHLIKKNNEPIYYALLENEITEAIIYSSS